MSKLSKKSGFAVFLLVVLAVAVVFFGMNYSKKQQQELVTIAEKTDQKDEVATQVDTSQQIDRKSVV